jgi:hypothetical protein
MKALVLALPPNVVKVVAGPPLTEIVKNESACADVERLSIRIDAANNTKRLTLTEGSSLIEIPLLL